CLRRRGGARPARGDRGPVLAPRPSHSRPVRRLGNARGRGTGIAGAALPRICPPADSPPVALPGPDPGCGRAVQGDVRTGAPAPRLSEPPPGRPRSLRRLPRLREGPRPLSAAVRG